MLIANSSAVTIENRFDGLLNLFHAHKLGGLESSIGARQHGSLYYQAYRNPAPVSEHLEEDLFEHASPFSSPFSSELDYEFRKTAYEVNGHSFKC